MPAIPGARQLLDSSPSDSWAVVTSGSHAIATARMASAGLPSADVLVTGGDVDNGKPFPDPYLLAAQRLQIPPGRCAVFEDAPAGIAAARAAGVTTIIGVGATAAAARVTLAVADLRGVRFDGHQLRIDIRRDPVDQQQVACHPPQEVLMGVPERMRRVVVSPGSIDVVESPTPEPMPGEILVHSVVTGVCGSDTHAAHGRHPFINLPYYPGHEVVGVIAALGPGVDTVAVGQRVTVEPDLPCWDCKQCRGGTQNLCENLRFFGCGHDQGGMADYFTIPVEPGARPSRRTELACGGAHRAACPRRCTPSASLAASVTRPS